jgi:hypothetical protein
LKYIISMNDTSVSKHRYKESAEDEGAEVPTGHSSSPVVILDEKQKCFVFDAFQEVSELHQCQQFLLLMFLPELQQLVVWRNRLR